MLQQVKSRPITVSLPVSLPISCTARSKTEKSSLSLQKVNILGPDPPKSMKKIIVPRRSSMHGSLRINKNLSYNISYESSPTNFQISVKSPTSTPDSTLGEKDIRPFWTNSSKIISQKLWIP